MTKAFKVKDKLTTRDWGKGLYIFSFEWEDDRQWVLNHQPWHFENHLFAIRALSGYEQPSMVSVTEALFWVRAYDLPMNFHTDCVLKTLASKVRDLILF
ncbi:hypothetical protein ACS0TY_010759 [Phlomoides rotata]